MSSNPFGDQNSYGQNPYGQNPYGAPNPYSSPNFSGPQGGGQPLGAKLMAPAIALVITGALGLLLAIVGVVIAFSPAPPVNPNAPPAMQSLQRGGHGPAAVVVQGLFVLVNGFIIFGAVQTMRQKMRGLGIAASVAAMLNFANCCCLLGIPIGIWSLVILMQDDVKRAFDANANSY